MLEERQLEKKIKRLENPEDWLCFSCKSADCNGCNGYRRSTEWQVQFVIIIIVIFVLLLIMIITLTRRLVKNTMNMEN